MGCPGLRRGDWHLEYDSQVLHVPSGVAVVSDILVVVDVILVRSYDGG